MEITLKELEIAINEGNKQYSNFFDTFGFIVIRDVLPPYEFKRMLKEYDSQYMERMEPISIKDMIINRLGPKEQRKIGFKRILKSLIKRPGMRFLPNFLDGSKVFTDYFLGKKFEGMYEYFAGKNWLYLGSDGSNFVTTSFPWHRDWYTKMPLLKFNYYYNPFPFLGGKFLIIPGSNFTQDSYASYIQHAMSWPMQNSNPGGLAENGRLPFAKNPRDVFNKKQTKFDIPHIQVKLNRGDVVLFDHRCVHAVQNTWPKFQRRLMTVLISKNANDFSENHHLLQKYSKDELMSEVVDLIVNERNHIGCPPYGDALLSSPFIHSNHYINIEKSDSEKYNLGEFKLSSGRIFSYKLDFERYASIGANYRAKFMEAGGIKHSNSQNFSYENVHLGINAQNIDLNRG